jgi:hypothetical protein
MWLQGEGLEADGLEREGLRGGSMWSSRPAMSSMAMRWLHLLCLEDELDTPSPPKLRKI